MDLRKNPGKDLREVADQLEAWAEAEADIAHHLDRKGYPQEDIDRHRNQWNNYQVLADQIREAIVDAGL